MSEEQKNKKTEVTGFFKKVGQSITKIEKYPEMATEGVKAAVVYLMKIVSILCIVICLGTIFQANQTVNKSVEFVEKELPEFSYKDGILTVESEEAITIEKEKSMVGKVIIDTKTEDEQLINQYINKLQEEETGVILLKNKAIIKSESMTETISYEYKEIAEQMQVTEFTKQDAIDYTTSSRSFNLYLSLFLTTFAYSFVSYLLTTLTNIILISIIGYLATWIARIKMKIIAIFNMAIYAVTLSVGLNIVYIIINMFTQFTIQYFQIMYVAVATIYLIAAIFMLKAEFVKKQNELAKIEEEQEKIKKNMEEEKNREREREKDKDKDKDKDKGENNKENKKKDSKNKEEKKENTKDNKRKKGTKNGEPEGAKA